MSDLKNIRSVTYNTVAEKLNQLDKFETIDLWRAQVNTSSVSRSEGICYPAAFISIETIDWDNMTLNVQEGKLKITVYVFFNRFQDTFIGATDKDDALEELNILDDVINQLQWVYKDHFFTELVQTSEQDLTERYERPAFTLSFEALCYNKLKLPNYVHN